MARLRRGATGTDDVDDRHELLRGKKRVTVVVSHSSMTQARLIPLLPTRASACTCQRAGLIRGQHRHGRERLDSGEQHDVLVSDTWR
jgi:hypothetical protein